MKLKKAYILIAAGLMIFFISAIASGALTEVEFDRSVNAGIIVEEGASSGLDFGNFLPGQKSLVGQHDVDVWVGSITNTGVEDVDLYITGTFVSVINAQNQNMTWTNTITAGGQSISFSGTGYTVNNGSGNIVVTVPVNGAVDVYSKITLPNSNRSFESQVAFSFSVDYGLYTMNSGNVIIQNYLYTK